MCDSDHLKKLLMRDLTRLRQTATEADGKLDASQVDSLERLARLVEVAERTEGKPPPRRWPVAAALVLALTIVSILVLLRVSTTQVELNIKVSEVRFDLLRQQQVTAEIALSALSAAGLRAVDVPRAKHPDGTSVSGSEESWPGVRLSLPRDGNEQDRLTLAALVPPAGTRLWIFKTGVPGEFALSLKHEDMAVRANVRGQVELTPMGSPAQTLDFGRGRAIEFRSGPNVMDVTFAPVLGIGVQLTGPVAAQNLWLQRAHENIVGRGPVTYSTILGGELYLSSVADRKYVLRAAETLRFKSADGEIRTLELTEDHILLAFRGKVSGMTTGTGSNKRSLMPTYLEWLQAHYALSLLWGPALYLFGLYVAVMRWWRTGA